MFTTHTTCIMWRCLPTFPDVLVHNFTISSLILFIYCWFFCGQPATWGCWQKWCQCAFQPPLWVSLQLWHCSMLLGKCSKTLVLGLKKRLKAPKIIPNFCHLLIYLMVIQEDVCKCHQEQHKGAKQIFVSNKGHSTWCQTQMFFKQIWFHSWHGVCCEAEKGWKRVASPRTVHSQCSKNSESCVHIAQPSYAFTHLSWLHGVFISSESCEHMPCHAIVRVMSVLKDIFPMLIATLCQFIAKIR